MIVRVRVGLENGLHYIILFYKKLCGTIFEGESYTLVVRGKYITDVRVRG
jgi:hypothetical protein